MAARSMIFVCFNEAEKGWLASCLEAVLKEAQGIEIVFVDDWSTDDTEVVVRGFHEVKYVKPPKRIGVGPGRNFGIAHSTGDTLMFCDGHIWPYPGCFDIAFEAAEKHPDRIIACTHTSPKWREGIPSLADDRYYRWNYGCSLAYSGARGWFYMAHNLRKPSAPVQRTGVNANGLVIGRKHLAHIQNWVNMPGFWGGNDAAMSAKAFLTDTPIWVQPTARMIHMEKPSSWHYAPLAMQGMTRIYGARALFDDEHFENFWKPLFATRYRWRSNWGAYLERARREQEQFAAVRVRSQDDFLNIRVRPFMQ